MSAHPEAVYEIVAAAGGRLVGKTRLQKTAYILEISELGFGFSFSYHYFGPYSHDVTASTADARADCLVEEREEVASWGGAYSVFLADVANRQCKDERFECIIQIASRADPVALELAATAAFLKLEGFDDAWAETSRRKPSKATDDRLRGARELWAQLRQVPVPKELPAL